MMRLVVILVMVVACKAASTKDKIDTKGLDTGAQKDWLVHKIDTPVTIQPWAGPAADPKFQALELTNGLISRVFSTVPSWATLDFRTYLDSSTPGAGASILRAIKPEARVQISLDL